MQEKKTTPNPDQYWDGTLPPSNTATVFGGGTGTALDPYIIDTAARFALLSANVRSGYSYGSIKGTSTTPPVPVRYFKLTCDIYLNAASVTASSVNAGVPTPWSNTPTAPYPWYPIGGAGAGPDDKGHSYCFGGRFDGDNHTIHNAFYNRSTSVGKGCNPANEVGIFGDITNEAEIKNLKTAGGYIGANISVGGIVGRTWGGDIINCHNENFVYGIGSQGAGGIAGTSWVYIPDPEPDGTRMSAEPPVINKCSNKATVVSNYFKNTTIPSGSGGGIVGENEGGVINCWNEAVVTCRLNAGGIVGSNQNSSGGEPPIQVDPSYINNCYNTGNIGHSAATGVNSSIPSVDAIVSGGIMGYQTGTCENVYNIGNITDNGVDTKPEPRNAAGQIIGELNPDANEINDYWHWYDDATPSNAVGSPIAYQPAHFSTFDDDGKGELRDSLNNWVSQHSSIDYGSWERDSDVNDGFPYLDI
ncbi:MAG: hypothetical protein LBK23_09475 [Oscillospiraceae bacterium]|nr:hypothetical protein [Oscillospiraceae bacterium]